MTEVELRQQIKLDAGVLLDKYWQGERITLLINQAQDWLQSKLMAQGSKQWYSEGDITATQVVYSGLYETLMGDIPSDWLTELPIESVMIDIIQVKPAKLVDVKNIYEIINNGVTTPTITHPIFWIDHNIIQQFHIYPRVVEGVGATGSLIYPKKVLDMVFDDNTVESEIPPAQQFIIVERVTAQIKSAMNQEQVSQAITAEISQLLAEKYQLEPLKNKEDKRVEQ